MSGPQTQENPLDWGSDLAPIIRRAAGDFNNENMNVIAIVKGMCAKINALMDAAEKPVIVAAPAMLAILEELEDSLDQQTFDERKREDFDAPDDREYSVNITAGQLRAISTVLNKAQSVSEIMKRKGEKV